MWPTTSDNLQPSGTERGDVSGHPPLRFSELSTSRQLLLRLCQAVNYGCIQDLQIRDSEPIFDPPPIVLMDVKLDAGEGARPESQLADFALCREVCRLFELLNEIKNTVIERIEVRGGIPRKATFKSWPSVVSG
jgi:hypothetical protein